MAHKPDRCAYVPHITDPDPPSACSPMTREQSHRAAEAIARAFPNLVCKPEQPKRGDA